MPRSTNAVAAAAAPRAPPPSHSIGRCARRIIAASASNCAASGTTAWTAMRAGVARRRAFRRCTSTGISSETGPAGAESAACAAASSASTALCGSQARITCLLTAFSMSGWRGTSWMAARSRSMKGRSIWLVMCSTGLPAVRASTCAPAALPAAVPVDVKQTPSERVTRAWASAMFIAPASPRAGMKRMRPWRAMASRIGMLWIEITPKACVTPRSASAPAIRSPTGCSRSVSVRASIGLPLDVP